MNKRILVTGSSRGIGKAIALKLAAQGYDITVHCRTGLEQAQQTCAEIHALGQSTTLLQFDVCDRAAAKQQIEQEYKHKRGAASLEKRKMLYEIYFRQLSFLLIHMILNFFLSHVSV